MPQLQLEERFISAIKGTERAANIGDITALARAVLAPQSFELGVCYGIAENVGGMARAFLSLTKMFVLAGLYDAARLPTWSVGSLMPLYLEGKAVEWLVGPAPLKAAYDKRNTLIRELGTAVMHPADLLGSAAKNIAQDYTSKWKRFNQAMRQTSLSATFEAGRISGEILVDVLMLIGTASEIAKATKFLAEIPELVRLSKSIGSASGRGFAEESNAAVRFSEAFTDGKPGTRWGALTPATIPKRAVGIGTGVTGDAAAATGGRLGSAATRAQNGAIADSLEGRGFAVTGGGGRLPEEYMPGPGGGPQGSTYVDVTATRGGRTVRVQTVDTRADGVTPTTREANAAGRIRAQQQPRDHTVLIPKRKPDEP